MKGTDFEHHMSMAGWRSVKRWTNTLFFITFFWPVNHMLFYTGVVPACLCFILYN